MVVPSSNEAIATARFAEGWEPFARGCLEQLGLELEIADDGAILVNQRPASDESQGEVQAAKRRKGSLTTRLRKKPADVQATEVFAADSPATLFAWLAEQIEEHAQLPSFAPTGEPAAVHEIASRMFAAYTVDGGNVHLGGCHLEATPLLRLTSISKQAPGNVEHRFFDATGEPLSADLVDGLHLSEVASSPEGAAFTQQANWQSAIAAARAAIETSGNASPTLATIVLARRAYGQLQVTIGEESLPINFDGWARTLTAPPAICPHSGEATFHLAALSDGRIAAANEIVQCEETGERLLKQESTRCSATGKLVGQERCQPCPVTGELTLPAGFATCSRCGQQVSRAALTGSGCRGCDQLAPAARGDQRLAKVLAAAPKLADRQRWRLAETDAALIAESAHWTTRLLVVVDKATGEVIQAATSNRFFSSWRSLSDDERRLQLG